MQTFASDISVVKSGSRCAASGGLPGQIGPPSAGRKMQKLYVSIGAQNP
jgi:hypothetical protein